MSNISLHVKNFNDRVRVMNQTNSRTLVLQAEEARNLHAEIFQLLAMLTNQAVTSPTVETPSSLDGGNF
jgi:hypothetical protein